MASYFIEKPTEDFSGKSGKKLMTELGNIGGTYYESSFVLLDEYPNMNKEFEWWCLSMAIKIKDDLYGQVYQVIAVSDVENHCIIKSWSDYRNAFITSCLSNEFTYKGHSFYVGWASGGGIPSYETCNVPICEEIFTDENSSEIFENAAKQLIDAYIADGGLLPGEEPSPSQEYSKVEYTRINWENKSTSLKTPLNESNLNKMDKAINDLCENLDVAHTESDVKKLDKSSANKLLSETPTWDADTGILTFEFFDGTSFSVDFNVEKIPVSFSMDSSGVITMETADGTKWTADISKAIPSAYTFSDGARVTFTETTGEDGTKKITADLVKGSITDEYLATDFLAKITSNVNAASSSATSAASSATDAATDAKLAQSYAIGGSGMRDGEDTDNAKYYAQKSAENLEYAKNLIEYDDDITD